MRSLYQRVKTCVTFSSRVTFALSFFSFVIYVLCIFSTKFADFFNHITAPVRISLSALSSIFSISLFEMIVIFLPLIAILLIFKAVKVAKQGRIQSIRMLTTILACLLTYFIFFVFTFASGYHTTKIEERLNLNSESIDNGDIYKATLIVARELNSLSNAVAYDENGASILPYTYKELSEKICDAYANFEDNIGIIVSFNSRVKPLLLSKALTYTHISGVYFPLTGEACVNTNYSDFIIASSSAHEMAHQRGIAREDEACLVGFLALTSTTDTYLNYSAYLNIYLNLLNELKREDNELYEKAKNSLNKSVEGDLIAYSKHFEKYRNSTLSKVSNTINNAYLQANGDKNGTKSYDLVSRLACAYLLQG